MAKLFWHNNDSPISRELYDPQTERIIGGVLRGKSHVWSVQRDSGDEYEEFAQGNTLEEAKKIMEDFVRTLPQYGSDVVIVDEPKVTIKIYENALRSIIACPEEAGETARDVLADPARWERERIY